MKSGLITPQAAIYVRGLCVKQPFNEGRVFYGDRGDVQSSEPIHVFVLHMPRVVFHPLTQLGGREGGKADVGGRGCHGLVCTCGGGGGEKRKERE